MVSINYATREVSCKVVYYGPGLSGKTTNLQYVHKKVPPETKGKLISLATDADRTLYFDFLPINIGAINGFAAKFQLYTVPGQVYYNATRKLVLRGVDGLVFVADSQPDKMDENIESLSNLKENLAEYGYHLEELPIVIQYNKQDLPGVLTPEQLRAVLNPYGWQEYSASATEGFGVFDTLKCILKLVLDKAKCGGTVQSATPVAAAAPAAPVRVAVPAVAERVEAPVVAPIATPIPALAATQAEPYFPAAPVSFGDDMPPVPPEPAPDRYDRPALSHYQEPAAEATTYTPPAPEKPSYRPFPGNTMDDEMSMRNRRTRPGDSGRIPVYRQEPAPSLQFEESADSFRPMASRPSATGMPRMEPSRKIDKPQKKRSFFKRLFGLK